VSREDAVLLVSRTIAFIQMTLALMTVFYLPLRVITLDHRLHARSVLGITSDVGISTDFLDLYLHLAEIACLLLLAWFFWKCGPRVSGWPLPPRKSEDPGI
jgi:hypothetical protein